MLWKKESDQESSMYIDLFTSPLVDSEELDKIYNLHNYFSVTANARHGPFKEKNSEKSLHYRQKGNAMFNEAKWIDAMELYNQSLCYAENGSELMGLAYANRSSCFFNMKMYRKCLVDLELAMENNYPSDKMTKLEKRKITALSMMDNDEDKGGMYEPNLDFMSNEKYPCFANVLNIENNEQYGRHIVATEDIEVGKTVMVDQNYFANSSKRYTRCNICLRSDENLKPCQKCSFTLICPKCAENDLHSIECDINPSYFVSTGIISARMPMVRSILLAINTFSDIDELIAVVEEMMKNDLVEAPEALGDPKLNYRAFFKLHPNLKNHTHEYFAQQIYFIYQSLMKLPCVTEFFHSEAHKRFLKHLIGHHLMVIKYSAQRLRLESAKINLFGQHCESQLNDYDYRMSIPGSYFNHSCVPNAYLRFQNGFTVCIALRAIRKNEQVYVPYDISVLTEEKSIRQQILQSNFNFRCVCERCKMPRLELSSMQSNYQIKSDFLYRSICMDVIEELEAEGTRGFNFTCARHFHDVMTPKCLSLLKKYGTSKWCSEIYDIIVKLETVAGVQEGGLTKVLICTPITNCEFLEY
ncbi:SET and MYND domain-containing protein 4-like [Contarinia nasturtii]|uniref:SET and MYND domain-containing protein 4-like n=1 Tax=Contarinia nasturtii TaxID=265458 RepID=UPI0012D46A49|nr:SET and MYND domain-containing protein 4-like [Contarinia nasturtii]